MHKKPELLAPAGNLEKLKIAFLYGADAVYVGNSVFGLRKYSENLSIFELERAVEIARNQKKKVYLAINGFAHNSDLKSIARYLEQINKIKPHALIIADTGILQLARKITDIPVHISTQASVTNKYTCEFWKKSGAKRIILAREVPVKELKTIKKFSDIEVEVFCHGAMCIGYSGKCIISNYTSARDANRGGCVQNCRHTFDIFNRKGQRKDTIHLLNSKDLMAVSFIPDFIKSNIDSLKIEGRMKSNLYVANTTRIYREAIDYYYEKIKNRKKLKTKSGNMKLKYFEDELKKVSNRTFCSGGLERRPSKDSINFQFNGYSREIEYIATVKEVIPEKYIFLEIKSPFSLEDRIELIGPEIYKEIKIKELYDMDNQPVKKTKPNSIVKMPWIDSCEKYSLLARKISP